MTDLKIVGKDVQRIDVREKATGKAKYALDLTFPGMLIGKILRSPYPHAKIVNINVSKAERLKGIKAVLTGKDVPKVLFGDYLNDQPVLAFDKVRFIGEPVAAVAALDADTAEEALNLIEVDYEELKPIFDPEKALEDNTNLIHDDLWGYERFPVAHPVKGTNICDHYKLRKGDVDKAFKEAYRVYEDRFTTQRVHHCYLESHVIIADVDTSGNIVVYGSLQSPHISRDALARVFEVPASKVRVIVPYVGGGFGGKSKLKLEPISVCLSQAAGRPVKITMSREEVFTSSVGRHPVIVDIRMGVNRDGEILASRMKIVWDTGAYGDDGPCVSFAAGTVAPGPYKIPNVCVDSYCVYTNQSVGGAMRGFGLPQVTFAHESLMETIAEDLGIDPVEIRLKNAVEEGSESAIGETLHSVGLKETINKVAQATDLEKKRPVGRGVGIASGHLFTANFLPDSAIVRVNDDGSIELFKGSVEMGQGTNIVLSQIVSEVMDIPVDEISTAMIDTEFTPHAWGTISSRQTFCSGNAVKIAAEDARKQLFDVAADKLKASPDDLVCAHGRVFVKGEPERSATLEEIARHSYYTKSGPIIGKGSYSQKELVFMDPETGMSTQYWQYYMYGTQVAEVEVDRETGDVNVLKLAIACDVGKAINPFNCDRQIEGGVLMAVGYSLHEELTLDGGKIVNANFVDYKLPRAKDVPEVIPIIVEAPHQDGPFGAKGLGEMPSIPTAPAISNAVYDAIGVRIKNLPITPEKILKALKEKGDS